MTKFTAFLVGAVIASAGTALLTTRERSEIRRLRFDLSSLQEQRAQFSGLAVEKARLSNLVAQATQTEASPNEQTHELLRLRGEVARLHRDLEDLANERKAEVSSLLQQNLKLRGLPDGDFYAASGMDSNTMPKVKIGATTNDVFAELRRVGANILSVEEKYIQAEVFPIVASSTNRSPLDIKVQFWFEDGKLISRREFPTWYRTESQQ